jgi:hypothetical protein
MSERKIKVGAIATTVAAGMLALGSIVCSETENYVTGSGCDLPAKKFGEADSSRDNTAIQGKNGPQDTNAGYAWHCTENPDGTISNFEYGSGDFKLEVFDKRKGYLTFNTPAGRVTISLPKVGK